MSPSETTPTNDRRGLWIALGVGLVIGALLVTLSFRESTFGGLHDPRIIIRINDLGEQIGRDVLVPTDGWVLQIELPEGLPQSIQDTLDVRIREERTGTSIPIIDQLERRGRIASLVVPESMGLIEGLFSVRASVEDADEGELVAYRRMRIRTWLGGPPIGSRQLIHFDFTVDRDEDGRVDFEQDLERLGLLAVADPSIASLLAERIAARALARVLRAYDPPDDPNGTKRDRDIVFVRFQLEAEPSPFVTRICVGGANAAHPGSVGNVRYDPGNGIKGASECEPRDGDPAAGLFPSEFAVYADNPLYRATLAPFATRLGGEPIGTDSRDIDRLSGRAPGDDARGKAIEEAIAVLGDALGTVMAHEAGHALGLVPSGTPAVGLFGAPEEAGSAFAHNARTEATKGTDETPSWLMDDGESVGFEDLAGRGESGELRFRPLNHAYLKDRIVLKKGRR